MIENAFRCRCGYLAVLLTLTVAVAVSVRLLASRTVSVTV